MTFDLDFGMLLTVTLFLPASEVKVLQFMAT